MTDMEPSRTDPPPTGPGSATDRETPRRRSQLLVMLGLFLTFAGLFAYGLQFPTQPANFDAVSPWLAIGFIALWTGAVLGGNAVRAPPPGVLPAFRAQGALSVLAVGAGVASAAVVVRRVGPWTSLGPGGPSELVAAGVGILLVGLGGFVMGSSMRRFVRRRPRGASGTRNEVPPSAR